MDPDPRTGILGRGRLDRDIRKKPSKTEAEAGMKRLQAKEQQGMPEDARSQERGKGQLLLRGPENTFLSAGAPPEALSHSPGKKHRAPRGGLRDAGEAGVPDHMGLPCSQLGPRPRGQGTSTATDEGADANVPTCPWVSVSPPPSEGTRLERHLLQTPLLMHM